MKRSLMVGLLVLVGVVAVGPCFGARPDTRPLSYSDTDGTLSSIRSLDNNPFGPGETIKLRATYLGLTAGYITMTVEGETRGERPLYRLELNARTGGLVEYIYTLEDRFISFFDRKGLFSWGYNYYQTHNGTSEIRRVRYDHADEYFTENGERKGKIKPYTQDLLSTMYFLRTRKFNDGDTLAFPLQTGDEYYDVRIKVDEDARVATKDGWKDAYELRPILTKSSHKKAAKDHVESISDIRIWLSHDERRIPLKISFPATFGSMQAFLERYRPPLDERGKDND